MSRIFIIIFSKTLIIEDQKEVYIKEIIKQQNHNNGIKIYS